MLLLYKEFIKNMYNILFPEELFNVSELKESIKYVNNCLNLTK